MPQRPTSTDAKRKAGTFRPSTARAHLKLPRGAPRPPDWLEPEARAEWARVVRALSQAGVVAKAHRSVLTCYSVLWGQYEQAKGNLPAAKMGELRRLMLELGLTPRSAAGVDALPPDRGREPRLAPGRRAPPVDPPIDFATRVLAMSAELKARDEANAATPPPEPKPP